jgi:hypothetical protein
MTKLALVPSNTAPEATTEQKPKYSPEEKGLIEQYQATLEAGRYFKLYDAASPFPRLISGQCPAEPLPLSFVSDDFIGFCREQGRRPPHTLPSPAYLTYKLQIVTGTVFKPKGPAHVRARQSRHRYANTYRAFEPEHPALPVSPHFMALLECMFPDPVERQTFVQYVAHMIQFPEVRPSWHPMILSETGTGKGFMFSEILTPLLCQQTVLVKRYSELTGRFANAMSGTILVQLDDCKSKREDVQTQLKSLMTEERVLLEEKGLAAGMVTTYTRFILASNEQVPLDIDDTERRWWIPRRLGYSHGLTGDEGRKERKQNVIQPLADWLQLPGAPEALHDYFARIDLSGFDPKSPPLTDTLREQIAKSVTVEQSFALDYLQGHDTKVLKSADLSNAFAEAGMSKPSNQAIGKLLEFAEYRQDSLTIDGKKSRWWFPLSMTRAEAEAILARPVEF